MQIPYLSLMRQSWMRSSYLSFPLLVHCVVVLVATACAPGPTEAESSPDPGSPRLHRVGDIAPPDGFRRASVKADSFAQYLRDLKLLQSRTVYLYNGSPKSNQKAHFRVVDLSVGNKDLQQCADALLRLRAEYHFGAGDFQSIRYSFTSGHVSSYQKWRQGYRPVIRGNSVNFAKKAAPDTSRQGFMNYLENLFTYAGTISLKRDSIAVSLSPGAATNANGSEPPHTPGGAADPRAGDFFLQSGSPGHAVMILDVVANEAGQRLYLLGQSYMPAQQFHVLKNPNLDGKPVPELEEEGAVWYSLSPSGEVYTPEWSFPPGSLRRWK